MKPIGPDLKVSLIHEAHWSLLQNELNARSWLVLGTTWIEFKINIDPDLKVSWFQEADWSWLQSELNSRSWLVLGTKWIEFKINIDPDLKVSGVKKLIGPD